MRTSAIVLAMVVALGACSDEASEPTTSTAPPESTTTTQLPTTTTAPTTTSTTEAAETTTTTTLPESEPKPELEALAGIWTSVTINSWSIKLDGYTITAGGNPTNLVIPGTADYEDGELLVRGIDLGFGGCGEAVGRYTAERDGDTLTIELVEDECERRSEILPGTYRLDG